MVTFDFLSVNTVTKLGLHLTNTSNISTMFCPILNSQSYVEKIFKMSQQIRGFGVIIWFLLKLKTLKNVYSRPPYRLPMFQLVLRKQFDKLEKELVHYLSTIAFVYR